MFLSGFRDNTKQSVQGIKMLNSKVIVFANLWLSGCLAQYDMSLSLNCTLSFPVTLSITVQHKTKIKHFNVYCCESGLGIVTEAIRRIIAARALKNIMKNFSVNLVVTHRSVRSV